MFWVCAPRLLLRHRAFGDPGHAPVLCTQPAHSAPRSPVASPWVRPGPEASLEKEEVSGLLGGGGEGKGSEFLEVRGHGAFTP